MTNSTNDNTITYSQFEEFCFKGIARSADEEEKTEQVDNVETWNGTSWSETTEVNTARDQMCDGAGSSSTNALIYGGATPSASALTEQWDGTSWSNLPASSNLNCIRRYSFGIGLPSAGMQTGGQKNPNSSK